MVLLRTNLKNIDVCMFYERMNRHYIRNDHANEFEHLHIPFCSLMITLSWIVIGGFFVYCIYDSAVHKCFRILYLDMIICFQ